MCLPRHPAPRSWQRRARAGSLGAAEADGVRDGRRLRLGVALVCVSFGVSAAHATDGGLPTGARAESLRDGSVDAQTLVLRAPSAPTRAKRMYEPLVFPVLGNDPDLGFKFGIFSLLTKSEGEGKPFLWRLQFGCAFAAHEGATGLEVPYRQVLLQHDFRSASGATLVSSDIGHARTTNLGYFGLGNTSPGTDGWRDLAPGSAAYVRARQFNQFDSSIYSAGVSIQHEISAGWRLHVGLRLYWTDLAPYADSQLATDLRTDAHDGHRLFGLGPSFYPLLSAGVVRDTRDHEVAPTVGAWHEAILRCSPGGYGDGGWCGATVAVRGYRRLVGQYLTIAGRLLGDVLFGRPSFLELSRFGGLQASFGPGGGMGVRGVPQGRYHGRTKLIANVELRSFFWKFRIAGQRVELGAAAFVDMGRVWTDTLTGVASLDGTGIGLHYGVGAGVRLRWGDAAVIRFDFAYSPVSAQLGSPIGFFADVAPVL